MNEAMPFESIEYILRPGTSWVLEVGRKERRILDPLYLILAIFPIGKRTEIILKSL
jgi:hypothetical protein